MGKNQFEELNYRNFDEYLPQIWEETVKKVDTMIQMNAGKSPHVAAEKEYDSGRLDWWTSGFWPGILWILHDITKEDKYKDEAWDWDEKIEQWFLRENNFHHDVGFQFLPTAVIKYKVTGDIDAKRRGLAAANFLAGRFNLAGQFLRAWNQEKKGWSIIDSMMNISILFWAAEEIDDPRFMQVAKAHADTVLRCFIREDGSVNHIVSFNAETGEMIESLGGQGYGPNSSWSRGQSWAIHGMANAYKYTKEVRYLNAAKRVAHYFIACLPDDSVPHWDFRVPDIENEPRDTSAATCAASGMLELADILPEEEARLYRTAAKKILASLTKSYAYWDKEDYGAILREGTGNKAANANVNVSLIYGDYYYVECLAKLKQWEHRIF